MCKMNQRGLWCGGWGELWGVVGVQMCRHASVVFFGGLMCCSVVWVRCTVLLVCTALVCTGVHGGVHCIGVG